MKNQWVWLGVAAAVGWYLIAKRQEAQRLAAYDRLMNDYRLGLTNQASAFAPRPCSCGQLHQAIRL